MATKPEPKFRLDVGDVLQLKSNKKLLAVVTDVHGESIHYVMTVIEGGDHARPADDSYIHIEMLGQIEREWDIKERGHIFAEKEAAAARRKQERAAQKALAS